MLYSDRLRQEEEEAIESRDGKKKEGETEEQGRDVSGQREGKAKRIKQGNDPPLVDTLAVMTVCGPASLG